MTRVFVNTPLAEGAAVTLTGETAHYLHTVLRVRQGARFLAVDATGRECETIVEACRGGEVWGRVVAVRPSPVEPRPTVILYQALLKNRNFELVLQKCTELGVAAFVPMLTERTVPRPAEERLEGRTERWARIVSEACRQCGRALPPPVASPLAWHDALRYFSGSGAVGLIAYEGLGKSACRSLHTALAARQPERPLAVFIGPEGGFTAQEMEQAREAGLLPVSLGPLILRAETAAVCACSVIMYELEDW